MWKRHEETRNAEAATPQTLEGTSVADNSYNVTWNDISQAVTELESRTGVRPVVPHLGGDVKVRRDRKGHPTPANGSHHADILIGLYLDRKVSAAGTAILVLRLNSCLHRIGGYQGLSIRRRQV